LAEDEKFDEGFENIIRKNENIARFQTMANKNPQRNITDLNNKYVDKMMNMF
jgi:hypothetical protein